MDTGLFKPVKDSMALAKEGTELLRIDKDDNIFIRGKLTTDPLVVVEALKEFAAAARK